MIKWYSQYRKIEAALQTHGATSLIFCTLC